MANETEDVVDNTEVTDTTTATEATESPEMDFSSFDDMSDDDFFKLSDEELNGNSYDEDEEADTDDSDTEYPDSDTDEEQAEDVPDEDSDSLTDFLAKPLNTPIGEVTLNSKEELVQLLNTTLTAYKTLESMAPDRKTMQLLRDNGLTKPEDVNFLLDVMSGNPEAIKKLIRDKDIDVDVMDFDEDDTEYKPTQRDVSSTRIHFKEVTDELKQTQEGQDAINRINAEWDDFSKEQLVNAPDNLRFLAQHIKDGSYDRIQSEVKRRKMLGTLAKSTSTVQAYFLVGEELFGSGKSKQPKQATDRSGRNRVGRQPKIAKPSNTSFDGYSTEELDKMSDSEYFAKFKG